MANQKNLPSLNSADVGLVDIWLQILWIFRKTQNKFMKKFWRFLSIFQFKPVKIVILENLIETNSFLG